MPQILSSIGKNRFYYQGVAIWKNLTPDKFECWALIVFQILLSSLKIGLLASRDIVFVSFLKLLVCAVVLFLVVMCIVWFYLLSVVFLYRVSLGSYC